MAFIEVITIVTVMRLTHTDIPVTDVQQNKTKK